MEATDAPREHSPSLQVTSHTMSAKRSAVVEVALAEFSALRSEIDNLANAHRAMIGLNITVVVAISGFILAEKARPQLLLVIPLASGAIGLVYQWYVLHAKHIGDYINDSLRPLLIDHTQDERVLAWEQRLRTKVYARRGSGLAGQLAYLLLFPTVPVASLAIALLYLDSGWHWAAWLAGAALSVAQVTIWFWQARKWVCWT
ncbi:hypothetical protein AB0M35_27510 [Micromonospora sp. NPDC051196]|uniref:hypothetical protein n=1 Tax=Micromonospora sp. NPDC051196 TaxID=3155281 RepID=UPI003439A4DB